MAPACLDTELLLEALIQAGECHHGDPVPHDAADANLSNRELDDVSILAVETPLLENLNLAFNHLRRVNPIQKLTSLTRLNLSHNELLDVERLGALQDLQVLNLSKNKLSSIGSISALQQLEELWLRDNHISDLHALQGLGQCSSLKRLVVKPNPVCKSCPELYFHFLVHNIAGLEMLDGRPVGAAERDSAAAFLLSPEGRKMLREAGLSPRSNARVVPPAHLPADGGEAAHAGGRRRPASPKRAKKIESDQCQSGSSRSGRSARVPLSHRAPEEKARLAAAAQASAAERKGLGGGGADAEKQGGGYRQLYSNGQVAVVSRHDGASEARYFNGSIAVSLDNGRMTAMYRNGDVAVTSDAQGNAMVCLPSGLVIYNHTAAAGGRLCDMVTGSVTQEWDPHGKPTGDSANNPMAASEYIRGGMHGNTGVKALLQCRLNEHIGVRVDSAGGKVEVFFVCDSSGAKGGGGGLPSSTRNERAQRIKHRFSASRPAGKADWDDSGPFGDGAPPPRERGPVVQPITTDEYIGEIRAATEQIIDFEALKANLGSGGDEIALAFRGKISASGTQAGLASTSGLSGKHSKTGAAARRAAYDNKMRGKQPKAASLSESSKAWEQHHPGDTGLKYADPPLQSHSPGPYSQLQSYGTPTGSPSSKSPSTHASAAAKASSRHGRNASMSPKSPRHVLKDDPSELVQQLARNAQDALKRLTTNLAQEAEAEARHKASPIAQRPSPTKQRARGGVPPRAPGASARGFKAAAQPRAAKAAGADKYLSPGGGFNGSLGDGGLRPGERRGSERAGRKKDRGGGEKLSTGEDVTPDLPAEEMQRLAAIRAQMQNMLGSLSHGY